MADDSHALLNVPYCGRLRPKVADVRIRMSIRCVFDEKAPAKFLRSFSSVRFHWTAAGRPQAMAYTRVIIGSVCSDQIP